MEIGTGCKATVMCLSALVYIHEECTYVCMYSVHCIPSDLSISGSYVHVCKLAMNVTGSLTEDFPLALDVPKWLPLHGMCHDHPSALYSYASHNAVLSSSTPAAPRLLSPLESTAELSSLGLQLN